MTQGYDFNTIRAVIGLGNPGAKYYKTRHSIGFRVVEALGKELGDTKWHSSEKMEYLSIQHPGPSGGSLYIIKPQTFMNSSGEVLPWLTKKGIKAADILVVHDELEKPFGGLSIKQGGSARGHNGLRSFITGMGQDFWRMRFGVGRPQREGELISDYVLAPFSPAEETAILLLIKQAVEMILK